MSFLLDYNPGTQQWGFPRRGGAQLSGTIIVHTAECAADNVGEDTSAEGCANMIANRADYGSYHRLVDSDSIIEMLPWEYEAWQDSETNNWAVGISAALRTTDWAVMPADRRDRVYRNLAACAADFVRYMAGKGVTVPLVRISGAQARARVPGFCAHGDSGIARSDPGANFDWSLFFNYTAQALAGGISLQSASIPKDEFLMALTDEQQEQLYYINCEREGQLLRAEQDAEALLKARVQMNDGGTPQVGEILAALNQNANIIPALESAVRTLGEILASDHSDLTAEDILNMVKDKIIKVNVSVEGGKSDG